MSSVAVEQVTAKAVVGAFAAPLTPVLTGRFDRRVLVDQMGPLSAPGYAAVSAPAPGPCEA